MQRILTELKKKDPEMATLVKKRLRAHSGEGEAEASFVRFDYY